MSTEKNPPQPIGAPRRGPKLGKSKNDDYVRTSPYIRRDTLRRVRIELERRKQRQQPITGFNELVEVLLIGWLRHQIDKDEIDEIDELPSYNEPARKGMEK